MYRVSTPGPNCQIEFWLEGYKRYHIGCVTCDWYPVRTFPSKKAAKAFFTDHKHDAPWTYSDAIQKAIANLTNAGLV